MGRDLCSSPPWVPFYAYTMFQNPIYRPSCNKSRKTMISQKVLVTQSSNIVHCDWHTQKPTCADIQAFSNIFSLFKLMGFFFHFSSVRVKETAKNFTFSWIWLGKMHRNCLSGVYLGFKACQIQWHLFWDSIICSSWKITILGDTQHKMGLKPLKWDETYAAVLLGSHFMPTLCFRTLYLDLSVKNQEKPW